MVTIPAGYKLTNVGVIPEEWRIYRIADVVEKVGSGLTPTGGAAVYTDYGRPFVRSQNVGWGVLNLDDIAYIDELTHSTFPDTEIAIGDVLLNITGASIGRCAVANEIVAGGNVNQHVCIIRTIPKTLHSLFLAHFLLSSMGQKQVDSFQTGGNRQGLNFGQIRTFSIPLPPIAEQTAIAEVLSDVDAHIANLDALIIKQRGIKQATLHDLLTGRRRLPGFGDGVGYKQTDVGIIPEEWEVAKFGELVGIRKTKVFPQEGYADIFCVELEHISQGSGQLIGQSEGDSTSAKTVFQRGDILFGKLRAYLRKFWHADRGGICSTEIWAFFSKSDDLSNAFLFQDIQLERFIEAASVSYGTHMPRTDWGIISEYSMVIPPLAEQTAIAAVLSDIDAEIAALEAERDKTRALKQAMMHELLTGKTRLL